MSKRNVWVRRSSETPWHRVENYEDRRAEVLCGDVFIPTHFYDVASEAGPTATPVYGKCCTQCEATADQAAFLDEQANA